MGPECNPIGKLPVTLTRQYVEDLHIYHVKGVLLKQPKGLTYYHSATPILVTLPRPTRSQQIMLTTVK